jgi:hypothetical protein
MLEHICKRRCQVPSFAKDDCSMPRDPARARLRAGRNGQIDMRTAKVQSLRALRDEMKAVARGERRAPSDASRPSFNSIEAVVRLLTPDNRRLLALRVRRGDRLSVLPMHGNESELPKFLVAKIKKQLGIE